MPGKISSDWRCIDCGEQLSAAHVKRCVPCHIKSRVGTTRPLKEPGAIRENGITYWLRPCSGCGATARIRGGNAIHQKAAYCSAQCRTKAQIEKFNRRAKLICAGCGNSFQIPQAWVRKGCGRFCSRACYRKYSGETGPEIIARKCLESLSVSFVQEHKIGRFFIDFYIPDRMIALEIDGAYWHIPDAAKDARRDDWLKRRGITVVRIDAGTMTKQSPAERLRMIATTLHVVLPPSLVPIQTSMNLGETTRPTEGLHLDEQNQAA